MIPYPLAGLHYYHLWLVVDVRGVNIVGLTALLLVVCIVPKS